ncbi:DUF3179 domain-containing (seleno)protein [Psychromonas ossibalaenae]|uniref:DUF3179 domain-containing (seleno)protein n=1 Tax=Psychromonas ossibalaenae TaxID=444922 RepID=UPI0003632853|nr:DUF3179 domain-containing (seleno)protein [Psychromonas ossibalaenae]
MRKLVLLILPLLFAFSFIQPAEEFDAHFKTNFSKNTIDLKKVLSGGPGKDGIPAIDNPKFIHIKYADIRDDALGVLLKIENETRFYPFNILVWHEIINDQIGDKYIAVTFCPLCGSAIAFNKKFAGRIHRFGVTGYLYESNLLMYDSVTESFWSQSLGQAVIGDYSGRKLEVMDVSLLQLKDVKKKYPNSLMLSTDTGFNRNYNHYPYEDYETSDAIYFPISKVNAKYHAKEIMYVFRYKNTSFAFPLRTFLSGKFTHKYSDTVINIINEQGEIKILIDGEEFPGYYEMWFSWVIHNSDTGVVLDKVK